MYVGILFDLDIGDNEQNLDDFDLNVYHEHILYNDLEEDNFK